MPGIPDKPCLKDLLGKRPDGAVRRCRDNCRLNPYCQLFNGLDRNAARKAVEEKTGMTDRIKANCQNIGN